MTAEKSPEFSHEIDLDELPAGGRAFRLKADANARERVATRLGAPNIAKFDGEVKVSATKTRIDLLSRIEAVVARECVACLERFDETVAEDFELTLLRSHQDKAAADENPLADEKEVHEGRILDIGEVLTQQLSLAIDPFPRHPECQSLAEKYGRAETESPFLALQPLVEKDKKKQ